MNGMAPFDFATLRVATLRANGSGFGIDVCPEPFPDLSVRPERSDA